MKIKKYLLALLLSSSAFLLTGSLGAETVMSAEAALAAGDEIIIFKQHPQTEPESSAVVIDAANIHCE